MAGKIRARRRLVCPGHHARRPSRGPGPDSASTARAKPALGADRETLAVATGVPPGFIRYTLLERSRPHLTGDTPASDGGSRRARGVSAEWRSSTCLYVGKRPRGGTRERGTARTAPACVDKVALPAVASGPYGPRYRAHDPVHDPAGVPLHGTPSGIGRAPDDERDPLTPSSS